MTHHPPVAAELAEVLAGIEAQGGSTITPGSIDQIRAMTAAGRPSLEEIGGDGVLAEEVQVLGQGVGTSMTVLVLRPQGPVGAGRPGILHLHGGGFFFGDQRATLGSAATWVGDLGAVVVSPDYRLAPEHPFPAGVEDAYAALVWLHGHAEELGVDASSLVVAGPSAGGGLAAALALVARERGGPALAGQMMLSAMLDDRALTPSSSELRGEGVWDATSNATGWDALLGDARGGPDVSSHAAPAREPDLSGLPPAYLDVGSLDVLRDEVVEHALRLWRAGGDAELHVWPGAFHSFDLFAPDSTLAQRARTARTQWLRRVLGA